MTITITPDATYTPPRVAIQVEVDAGGTMQTVAVYRTVDGVRELIQDQPAAGLDDRTVYDYWMPYEVPVTYDWESDYASPLGFTTELAETWSALTGWTVTNGTGGTWVASGGMLVRQNAPDRASSVRRSFTPARYRITFAAVPQSVPVIDFGSFQIDTEARRIIAGSLTVAYVPGTTTWVVNVTATGVSLITSAGTYTLTVGGLEVDRVDFLGSIITFGTRSASVVSSAAQTNGYEVGVMLVASGRLFVALNNPSLTGAGNHLIDVFDATTLAHLVTLDLTGGGNPMYIVYDMKLDSSGRIVFATQAKLMRFSIGGSGAGTTLTYVDQVSTSPKTTTGVAVDSAGNIFALHADEVKKYNSSLVLQTSWGSAGDGDSQFRIAKSIAASGTNIYVVDSGYLATSNPPQIRRFTNAGVFVARAGVYGSGNGQWTYQKPPARIDASGSVLYVNDTSGRLQAFTEAMGFLTATDVEMFQGKPTVNSAKVYGVVFPGDTPQSYEIATLPILSASVDDVTIELYGGDLSIAETADPITLEPENSWLIHPSKPPLSVPLSYDDLDATVLGAIGEVRSRSNTVLHEVFGESLPVSVNTGPRSSDELELIVATETSADLAAMRALLLDDLPLLIRTLPSWEIDFTDGFYQVGDVFVPRNVQAYGQPSRAWRLPMRAVSAPDVDIEQSGWSWASLASEFPTWDAVKAAFATWADVFANVRRPGF